MMKVWNNEMHFTSFPLANLFRGFYISHDFLLYRCRIFIRTDENSGTR